MADLIKDDLEGCLQQLYFHEYYCERLTALMGESLYFLEFAKVELEQKKKSELGQIRQAKKFLKILQEINYELQKVATEIFQAVTIADREIHGNLISVEIKELSWKQQKKEMKDQEIEEAFERQHKKLDSFIR